MGRQTALERAWGRFYAKVGDALPDLLRPLCDSLAEAGEPPPPVGWVIRDPDTRQEHAGGRFKPKWRGPASGHVYRTERAARLAHNAIRAPIPVESFTMTDLDAYIEDLHTEGLHGYDAEDPAPALPSALRSLVVPVVLLHLPALPSEKPSRKKPPAPRMGLGGLGEGNDSGSFPF